VRKAGADGFNQYIQQNKKDLILFKTTLFAQEAKADPIKKSELIRDIVESIGKIPDTIHRSVYTKECSQLFDISEQILITEVNKIRRKKAKDQKDTEEKTQRQQQPSAGQDELPEAFHQEQMNTPSSTLPLIERDVIRILIEFGAWITVHEEKEISVAQYVLDELEGLEIDTPQYKLIYTLIKRELADGKLLDEKFFTANDDEKIRSATIEILAQPHSLSDNWWNKYKIAVPDKKSLFQKDIN
jgi:DNA primase